MAWTPKQIIIHIYSSEGMLYDAVQSSEEWGELLAKLGDDEWEMVAAVPTRPADHTLYYFKRVLDPTIRENFEQRQADLRAEWEKYEKQRELQRQKEIQRKRLAEHSDKTSQEVEQDQSS